MQNVSGRSISMQADSVCKYVNTDNTYVNVAKTASNSYSNRSWRWRKVVYFNEAGVHNRVLKTYEIFSSDTEN